MRRGRVPALPGRPGPPQPWGARALYPFALPGYARAPRGAGSYAPASRRLMVNYLSQHCTETRFARQVTPRNPYRESAPEDACAPPRSVEELMRVIGEIEQGEKGVPV